MVGPVAGLVAGVAGCSAGSSAPTAGLPPSSAVSSAAGSAAASASAGASAAADGTEAFLAYLRERLPGVPWVQSVRSVRVVDGQARVDTTLTQEATVEATATQVCTAVRAFLPADGAPVSSAIVLDRNGQTIVEC